MKSCQEIFKILIRINFFASLSALLVFVVIRGQQSVLTSSQQEKSQGTLTYRSQIPEDQLKTSKSELTNPEVVTITQYRQLEEQLEALEKQIIIHKTAFNQSNNPQNTPSKPQMASNVAVSTLEINLPKIKTNPIAADQSAVVPNHPLRPVKNTATVKEENPSGGSETVKSLEQPRIALNLESAAAASVANNSTGQATPAPQKPANTTISLAVIPPPEKNPETAQENPKNQPFSRKAVHSPVPSEIVKEELIRYANDISAGLLVAGNKGHINYGTTNYRRVQTAIVLLRQGEDMENAARRAKIPLDTLQQLIKWGENRPGSFTASTAHDSTPKNWN
jgi:hypothetical protein